MPAKKKPDGKTGRTLAELLDAAAKIRKRSAQLAEQMKLLASQIIEKRAIDADAASKDRYNF
jgi:hypothetical protein